jgi:hypothetical protein
MILVHKNNLDQELLKKKGGKLGPWKKPGYWVNEPGFLMTFPDAKTLVLLNESLVPAYEEGYAKNRDGWPYNSSLRQAAGAHSLIVSMNLDKLPAPARREAPDENLKKLVVARSALLSLDIKSDGIGLGLRGDFHEASEASDAAKAIGNLVKMGTGMLDQLMSSPQFKAENDFAVAPLRAVRSALDSVKTESSGKLATATMSIKADGGMAAMAAGIMLPAVQKVREAAARSATMNNLRQIGIAIHNCNDQVGWMPISGTDKLGLPLRDAKQTPGLSWRVAILPYIEQENLFQQFKHDEPWDSPHNKALISRMPKIFQSPSSPNKNPGETHYQMFVGPKALQPGLSIQRISSMDGVSNTIGVIEVADPVIWTKPDDIAVPGDKAPSDLLQKARGLYRGGVCAMFLDGSVRFIPTTNLTAETLWALITPSGGEVVNVP